MKRPIKAQMATPRKPFDQIRAFPRRAIALTFAKENCIASSKNEQKI